MTVWCIAMQTYTFQMSVSHCFKVNYLVNQFFEIFRKYTKFKCVVSQILKYLNIKDYSRYIFFCKNKK